MCQHRNSVKSDMRLGLLAHRQDSDWHHVAVTWSFETGKTELFFDGVSTVPTWKASAGQWQSKTVREGGVDPHMAAQTLRLPNGEHISFILSLHPSEVKCFFTIAI